jgi:DNA-directed RNA polymerase specialized sigma24 family protein
MFRDQPGGDGYGVGYDPGYTPQDVLDCDAAINRLPREHKRVVVMHYHRQGGIRRTARELGMSFHAVRDSLSFAHGALHVLLDKRKDDHQNMRQFDNLPIRASSQP